VAAPRNVGSFVRRRCSAVVLDLAHRVSRWCDDRFAGEERFPAPMAVPGDGSLDHELLHEARASLAGVLRAAELLTRTGGDLTSQQRQRLTSVLDQELHRLGRVLEGVPLRDGPCSLDRALEPVVDARRLAGQRVEWEPSGHWADIGSDQVAEIVNTLLVNADKHAPGALVRVAVTGHRGTVHIRVSDDGPGIPSGLRPHVLSSGVHGTQSQGEGLGLAVASRLAAEAGGELRIGEAEHGTAFVLQVPCAVPGARS
jgi:signal transduction histidine kinase